MALPDHVLGEFQGEVRRCHLATVLCQIARGTSLCWLGCQVWVSVMKGSGSRAGSCPAIQWPTRMSSRPSCCRRWIRIGLVGGRCAIARSSAWRWFASSNDAFRSIMGGVVLQVLRGMKVRAVAHLAAPRRRQMPGGVCLSRQFLLSIDRGDRPCAGPIYGSCSSGVAPVRR